ncbi:unnamed protein product [Urochloa decumbens]|uniref:Disease resistance protein RPM1 n=1 Tax=Urochloa decumbens TaxID=240449 RepID=A0ABC9B3B6_9POAL
MANLATVSMRVVEGLAEKVNSAIKEEAEQWQIVERDLVFITGEFEMMQSFLEVADEERVKNNVVSTWVRQVRDLSYDVEDCIEFVIHLDTRRAWWLRMVPSCNCCKTEPEERPLDQAVAEIKKLKARAEDVSQRNMRYNLISDSGSKPSTQHQAAAAPPRPTVGGTALDMLAEERDAAKKQRGLVDLTKLITKKSADLQVISVWGTGGSHGVASVIEEAYDEKEICRRFRFRAWLKLTHPFNPQDFVRNLLVQFCANSGQGHVSAGDLGEEFVQQINTQTYLVVLEDLSSMAEWHALRTYLPDSKNGSRIIVSTDQLEIAQLCTGKPYQVSELKQFSADHSICVFFKEISTAHPDGPHHPEVGGMGSPSLEEKARHLKQEIVLFGRSLEAEKLQNLITLTSDGNKLHMVSVWGVIGVGKSTLLRSVYYQCMIDKNFKWYGWVDVPHPFNLVSFSRSILLCMYPEPLQIEDPIQECQKLLQQDQYILVVNGLQSKEVWDLINAKLICKASRSCVVVITMEESIATHCAVTDNAVCHIKGLDVDAALDLFRKELKKAGIYGNSLMVKQARTLVASKCGGLSKVLFALGSYLANRPKDILEQECRHLNANFMHELETNPEFESLRGLLSWIRSYLHACPGSLKLCILYASIFPEDCVTRRRRLVRRWIAEGYSKGTDSNTMVEYAEKLFDKLASLSIMSRSMQKKVTVSGCQLNGFFREYITSRPMEQKIFFPLEVSVLEGEYSLTTERVGQHLAIGSSWERDKLVYQSLDLSRLRSLTVFGEWQSFFISGRMRVLRVLDLENAQDVTNDDLEQIGKLLLRLKFLSLRRCKKIYSLPDSLCGLRQLQTLDIRHTSVVKLPPSIMKLRKLQYIRAGTTLLKDKVPPTRLRSRLRTFASSCFRPTNSFSGSDVGVMVTRGIGKMTALHTLGVVNISAGWGDILGDLKNLTQLRKLGVSGIKQNNILEFSSAISRHAHLESLSVHGEKMPIGVMSLINLKKLSLHIVTLLTQSEIEILEQLKRLQTLRLHAKKVEDDKLQFLVRQIGIDKIDPFANIKVLEIACKSSLHVIFDGGAMRKLELLKVDCSYGSSLEFFGLQDTISLKQVLVKGRCEDPLKEALEKQIAEHKNSPVLNLEEQHSS